VKKFAAIVLLIIFTISGIQVFAEDSDKLTFDSAKTAMLSFNKALKDVNNSERQAYIQFKTVSEHANSINSEGVKIGDYLYAFDDYTKMIMTKQKELLPEQMKNAWDSAQNNIEITQNKLTVSLRDLFLSLSNTYNDVKIKQQKFDNAEKIWEINKGKFAKGMLSGEDAEQSDYDYSKAKVELSAALRNKENSLRSFNSFLGVQTDKAYTDIEYKETVNDTKLSTVDFYVNRALENRQEIKSIQKDIELNQHQISILEKNQVYLIYAAANKEHSDVLFNIETLKTKLSNSKYVIEKEIKNAYIDVAKQTGNIKSSKNILDTQKRNLQKVTTQFQKGLITSATVEQLQISINEAENAYESAIFSYNTKIMKLLNASGLGPAY